MFSKLNEKLKTEPETGPVLTSYVFNINVMNLRQKKFARPTYVDVYIL